MRSVTQEYKSYIFYKYSLVSSKYFDRNDNCLKHVLNRFKDYFYKGWTLQVKTVIKERYYK